VVNNARLNEYSFKNEEVVSRGWLICCSPEAPFNGMPLKYLFGNTAALFHFYRWLDLSLSVKSTKGYSMPFCAFLYGE